MVETIAKLWSELALLERLALAGMLKQAGYARINRIRAELDNR